MFIHNPTDELIEELTTNGDVVWVELDDRSIELRERCPRCHDLIPEDSYCFCDWLDEPVKYEPDEAEEINLWLVGDTLHTYPSDWQDERNSRPFPY